MDLPAIGTPPVHLAPDDAKEASLRALPAYPPRYINGARIYALDCFTSLALIL